VANAAAKLDCGRSDASASHASASGRFIAWWSPLSAMMPSTYCAGLLAQLAAVVKNFRACA
jgi:hypothetical protein